MWEDWPLEERLPRCKGEWTSRKSKTQESKDLSKSNKQNKKKSNHTHLTVQHNLDKSNNSYDIFHLTSVVMHDISDTKQTEFDTIFSRHPCHPRYKAIRC